MYIATYKNSNIGMKTIIELRYVKLQFVNFRRATHNQGDKGRRDEPNP